RGLDRREPVDLAEVATEALQSAVGVDELGVEAVLEPAPTTGDGRLIERLVSNTGPAIDPSDLGRLFQPFQRLEGDRAGGADGLGLGLSIVRAIAAAHDAELDARPRPDGGLRVELTFPRR